MARRSPSGMLTAMLAHLCVAYDPSALAQWALVHAVRLARRCDARLTIVHVAPPTDDVVDERTELLDELFGLRDDVRCRQRLVATVAPLTKGVVADVRVFTGLVTPTIIDVLRAARPDLVIAGSRECRGIVRVLSAPLRDALLAEAPCPVVLVRSPPREPQPTVLALFQGEWTSDVAWGAARALANDLRAELVDHSAPRHSRDIGGVATVVSAYRRHRPLVTVLSGERMPGTRGRLGLSMTETVGNALACPLVVIPPRIRGESSVRTYRVGEASRCVVCDGVLPSAHTPRALR